MKRIVILLLAIVALTACKQDQWLDWKAMNQLWLEQNKTKYILPNEDTSGKTYKVETTPTGLQYMVLEDTNPTEARPSSDSYVVCDYTLDLINTIADKSYHLDQGTGTSFNMSEVVSGFAEGLKQIHNNGHVIIYVPYDLGYGTEEYGTDGYKPYIPPYSTLIFDVRLRDIY